MSSEATTPAAITPVAQPAKPHVPTHREISLHGAKVWATILIVLGIANGVGGIIIGTHITVPSHDFLGDVDGTKMAPEGAAVIGGAIGAGLLLICIGGIVICFANALKPGSDQPVR